MGNSGAIASRYNVNARLLREFDEALSFLKKPSDDKQKIIGETKKLLTVLEPIRETNASQLSNSLILDASEVLSIIHQRHASNWQSYQNALQNITKKLIRKECNLTKDEMEILNDVAEALDVRCTQLFRRMGEG